MYDIAIIGAGVVGCAIARELGRYEGSICVIERMDDVCCGTSKANSAIIHAGFDAKPGTLKAKLNVQGNAMMDELAQALDIPFVRCGSLVVCTKEQDPAALTALLEKGVANGVPGLRIVARDELLSMEPNLSEDVTAALFAPTGGIVCPFEMTIAFAENAHENGVEFFFDTEVEDISSGESGYEIRATVQKRESRSIGAKVVINAAGVYADALNNMVSGNKLSITARKGEYVLLDKNAGAHVNHTIFQLPGAMGKGVLVTPTVHGNLLVGPTAEDVWDKEAVNTTADGLARVQQLAGQSVKSLPFREVITSFAGLRAHEQNGDFVIGEAADAPGFYNAAGIESPGLSSAPAIGELVAGEVAQKLGLKEKADFKATRKGILRPGTLDLDARNALIREQPAYGNIICRCEQITEGEILDAIRRPLGAWSVDAIKRRTRAGMGRCQAGFCLTRTIEILARETVRDMELVSKCGGASAYIVGESKAQNSNGQHSYERTAGDSGEDIC